MVILPGFHAGNLPHFSPHNYRGISMGLQQTVMSQWTDCLNDGQMNPLMYGQKGFFLGLFHAGNFIQEHSQALSL